MAVTQAYGESPPRIGRHTVMEQDRVGPGPVGTGECQAHRDARQRPATDDGHGHQAVGIPGQPQEEAAVGRDPEPGHVTGRLR